MAEAADPKSVLAEILRDRPDLTSAATAIFDYTQYLLDDDERLTKSGALDGDGRDLVRTRTLELLGGPVGPEPELDIEDNQDDDDHEDDEDDDEDDEP